MKIAIFHNYMDNIGGAEMVGLTLARELKADLYTTNVNQENINKMGFSDVKPISIGKVPLNAPFRQQKAMWLFRNLNLGKKYDFYIIDGDWAMSGAVNNKPNLWYVHSPIREIWDSYKFVRQNMVPWYLRNIFDIWVLYNRFLNRKYVKHVTNFVCNSENTKKRLKKYLNKDAIVINPPVDTSLFSYKSSKDYWLSVNRLINHKRVDMQMNAFGRMPNEKLIVVGSYEPSTNFIKYKKYIDSIKPSNVEIKNWVSSEELVDLYSHCKGFITTSMDEDFGITPIEAMASGKFVIAPYEGGYKETIIDGVTGKLVRNMDQDKLVEVIDNIQIDGEKYRDECIKQAKKFDTNIFIGNIKNIIESSIK